MAEKKRDKQKKEIFLTIPKPILEKLENEKRKFGYTNLQETILGVLRESFFRSSVKTGAKRGRPKEEIDLIKAASRKNIFKKGRQGKIF